jgi:phosphate transport system ATP-binding protein
MNNSKKFNSNIAIKIKDFSCFYKTTVDKASVDHVSLEIPEKAVYALIGPSGCGKSTLLRSINRMNDIYDGFRTEGLIEIDGENILEKKVNLQKLRSRVGMIFQKPTVFPVSIFENIAFGLRAHGINKSSDIARIVEESLKKAAL